MSTPAADALDRLSVLQQQVRALGPAPGADEALDLWLEAAGLSVAIGRLDIARAALGDARKALERADRPIDEARVLLQWARVETKAGNTDLAERMLSAAAGLAEQTGNHDVQARALGALATRCTARGDHRKAVHLHQTASVLRDEVGDQTGMLEHTRAAATSLLLAGDPGAGFDLLSLALDHVRPDAGAAVPWRPILSARATAAWLARHAGVPGADNSVLDGILDDAKQLGEVGVAASLQLQAAAWATEAGELERAMRLAEEARQGALEVTDPVLYLQAAVMTAQHREVAGDDVGVLQMLHTARGTLGDLLGAEGVRPVLDMLEATHKRWGESRWDAAVAGLRSL